MIGGDCDFGIESAVGRRTTRVRDWLGVVGTGARLAGVAGPGGRMRELEGVLEPAPRFEGF